MKSKYSNNFRTWLATLSLGACLLGSASVVSAGVDAKDTKAPVIDAAPPDQWIHALLQLDFSDHYITPRGLDVENEGMIFQPLFLVFWDVYHNKSGGFLDDINITTGVWSSFHTHADGPELKHWNEFDPIGGIAFTFLKDWKFEINYTSFVSMNGSYPTSTHLSFQLDYDDSKMMGKFALHPYVAFWQEIHEKATVTFNPATSNESSYFTIGINPTFKLTDWLKVEFPTYINLNNKDFYQQFDGTGGGSGLGVFGTEAKFTIPLSFIPKDLGFWSFYAGVKYYHLNNAGLLDGNEVLTPNQHKKDLVQYHAGISIFF